MQGSAPAQLKAALLHKLQGSFVRMAHLPAPSHLLHTLYDQADIGDRELIAARLVKSLRALQVRGLCCTTLIVLGICRCALSALCFVRGQCSARSDDSGRAGVGMVISLL